MICRHEDRGTRGAVTKGHMPTRFRAYKLKSPRYNQPEGSRILGGAVTRAAGHCPQPIEGYVGRSAGMVGQHELLELDLWFSGGTGHATPGLILVDSGASHDFLSE